MCTTLYYIILTRWPLTNSQSIHFPQFATTRLSKIWFSRLTLISPYCYCDSYYYYYCYLLLLFVIIVVTSCVRLYDLFFCILSFLIGCPNALKVLANLTCGIWLCTNSSTTSICDIWINLFISCRARVERKLADTFDWFARSLRVPHYSKCCCSSHHRPSFEICKCICDAINAYSSINDASLYHCVIHSIIMPARQVSLA